MLSTPRWSSATIQSYAANLLPSADRASGALSPPQATKRENSACAPQWRAGIAQENFDIAFLHEFASQGLGHRLSGFYPAARQLPPGDVVLRGRRAKS
jgi:hypothetical protein